MVSIVRLLTLVGVVLLLVRANPLISSSSDNGLSIVVTSPNLVDDINMVKCEEDRVISILPQLADPHDYYLTPEDVRLLKQADLIVSTAHTHFELQIHELIDAGEINSFLIEIPRIPEVKIMKNPTTRMDNLHMPIYDPWNYLTFMRNVTETLERLNPSCSLIYEANYAVVEAEVKSLLAHNTTRLLRGIATKPVAQYAVAWLGVNVTRLVIPEEGVSPTTTAILEIENMLRTRGVEILVVIKGDEYSDYLRNLGKQYGVPVIEIPIPFAQGSIISKLEYVVSQISEIQISNTLQERLEYHDPHDVTTLVLTAFVACLLFVAVMTISRRGWL